jgi:hypothetical protein
MLCPSGFFGPRCKESAEIGAAAPFASLREPLLRQSGRSWRVRTYREIKPADPVSFALDLRPLLARMARL